MSESPDDCLRSMTGLEIPPMVEELGLVASGSCCSMMAAGATRFSLTIFFHFVLQIRSLKFSMLTRANRHGRHSSSRVVLLFRRRRASR